MKLALTGASGGIGRALVAALRPVHEVTAIVRTLPDGAAASTDIAYVSSSDGPALDQVLNSSECVVHCALDSKARGVHFLAANRALTQTILDGALGGACRLFVYFSSQVVYSGSQPPDDNGYREDQALFLSDREDDYTRLKIEGEREIIRQCRAAGVDYLIVRPTVVMGPGMAWRDGIVAASRWLPIGIRSRQMNLIDVDDLAAYVTRLIALGIGNEVFNLGTGNYPSEAYFAAAARAAGRRPWFMPEALLRLVGRVLPSTFWFFKSDVAIDCSKVAAVTGLNPVRGVDELFAGAGRAAAMLAGLKALQASGEPFKAYGAGFSRWFGNRGARPVSMAGYRGVTRLAGDRISVRAGTPLSEIVEHLRQAGLALATLPEFSAISAGACFFVPVHGSSARYFSLYDLITEIKYLDAAGNEVTSPRDEAEWATLRQRHDNFILTEVTFQCEPARLLANRMVWQDEATLDELVAGGYRENLSTIIQWYPAARGILVYNITPVAAAPAGAARALTIYRGLPYRMQKALLALKLRGATLQVDNSDAILASWRVLPLKPLWHFAVAASRRTWNDLEFCVTLADGQTLLARLQALNRTGELRFPANASVGIRFSGSGTAAPTGQDFMWIEFVSSDLAFMGRFIDVARQVCGGGLRFHEGKFRPHG